jgi:thiamine biosynthesis lipoprotein
MDPARSLVRRARPLLGTLVTVQARVGPAGADAAWAAMDAAFDEVALVHGLMSAHEPGSDLARLARARAGERVALHPHTRAVLRLAQAWCRASGGAFDAHAAGERLARRGRRPALRGGDGTPGRFLQLNLEAETIVADGPLRLDLGGLAKGYAVDQAVRVLRAHGVDAGLVNAGGDLRAFGDALWCIELQHPASTERTQRLLRLREGAVATSVRGDDFVTTRRQPGSWRRSTVLARDCASADALTKWALQARAPSLQLHAALARAGGRLWRD